jgi:hypothetical protein
VLLKGDRAHGGSPSRRQNEHARPTCRTATRARITSGKAEFLAITPFENWLIEASVGDPIKNVKAIHATAESSKGEHLLHNNG